MHEEIFSFFWIIRIFRSIWFQNGLGEKYTPYPPVGGVKLKEKPARQVQQNLKIDLESQRTKKKNGNLDYFVYRFSTHYLNS